MRTFSYKHFVAYYRISPDGNNNRNLNSYGIDAQKDAVNRFIESSQSFEVIKSFEEVESGANSQRRQLIEAIEYCRKKKATLVIAKLDRLSRNATFLLSLRDSGVEFVCCDMPQADRFTVGILALVAERERELISERTKAGLAIAKKRGVKLWNPNWRESQQKATDASTKSLESLWAIQLEAIEQIKDAGVQSYAEIARCLSARGVPTARGGSWTATLVRNLTKKVPASEHLTRTNR